MGSELDDIIMFWSILFQTRASSRRRWRIVAAARTAELELFCAANPLPTLSRRS